jgi:hypothetical protein
MLILCWSLFGRNRRGKHTHTQAAESKVTPLFLLLVFCEENLKFEKKTDVGEIPARVG